MNQRIKELFLQAGFHPPVVKRMGDEYKFEKFAELIVQDCVKKIAMIGISNFKNDDISWTVEKAIEDIRKHFGVEE